MSENCPTCGGHSFTVEFWESELGWGRKCFLKETYKTRVEAETEVKKFNDRQAEIDKTHGVVGTPDYYCWAELVLTA